VNPSITLYFIGFLFKVWLLQGLILGRRIIG